MSESVVEYRPEAPHAPDISKTASSRQPSEKHSDLSLSDDQEDEDGIVVDEREYEPQVNARVWLVVILLAMVWGLPTYAVSILQTITTQLAQQIGRPDLGQWIIFTVLLPIAILNLVVGTQSDLFGRRWFILAGALVATIGFIVMSTTVNAPGLMVGGVFVGAGGGVAQVANIASVELLPNKWRHVAIAIADFVLYCGTIMAPVTSRYGIAFGTWQWNFRALAILEGLTTIGLFFLYFPPPKPRGLPRRKLVWQLDYVGMIVFVLGSTLVLVGLVYAGIVPSSDPKVVGPLVSGFGVLVIFALWETFSSTKYPITPRNIFSAGYGRDATAPLIAIFFLNFVYYGTAIIWPTMINKLYTKPGPAKVTWKLSAELNTIQGFGFTAGSILQSVLGGKIRRWKSQLVVGMTVTTIFAALLALAKTNNRATIIAMLFFSQACYGWTFIVANATVQFGVEHKNLGLIGGIVNTARHGGGLIATAVYQTILLDAVNRKTKQHVTSTRAYEYGFKVVALASISFGVAAIVACVCCKDIERKMNEKIEVGLKKPTDALHYS